MYATDLSLSKARSNNKIYIANLARFELAPPPPNPNFQHNKEREKRACKLKSCYNSHDRDVGCAQNVWGYFCYTSLKSTLIHMFLCNKDFVSSSTQ